MVNGLRTNVLEQCLGRLALGICKVGAPFGVSLAMLIMEKTSPKKLQMEIVERCLVHRTREGNLNFNLEQILFDSLYLFKGFVRR